MSPRAVSRFDNAAHKQEQDFSDEEKDLSDLVRVLDICKVMFDLI